MQYDVIVVGLGAMGSAAAYQLSKTSSKVLGIEQFNAPHDIGSTHGDTRITRLAIGEGEEYVPLAKRSHEIWRELEQQTGYELLVQCGGLIVTSPGAGQHGVEDFIKPTVEVAKRNNIPYEILAGNDLQTRFPQFAFFGNESGYYEPSAGFARPEKCVQAQIEMATNNGATIKMSEKVLSYTDDGKIVTVKTDKGTYAARKLIVTTGPWINELIPEYKGLFKVYRQVLYWFDLKNESHYENYKSMPIFIWLFNNKDQIFGFPAIDGPSGGIKVATEYYGHTTTPVESSHHVTQDEIDSMYTKFVHNKIPGISDHCLRAASCLYTVTPDHKFVVDFHPDFKNTIIASPCSGHGFKHSAAIGEMLADMATDSPIRFNVQPFSMKRFSYT